MRAGWVRVLTTPVCVYQERLRGSNRGESQISIYGTLNWWRGHRIRDPE
jgi:hypothetical protein